MTPAISIRKAKISDIPALLNLADALVTLDKNFDETLDEKYNRSPEGIAWLEARVNDTDAAVFVAENDTGVICGMLVGAIEKPPPWRAIDAVLAELEMFCVAPEFRGNFFGRQLLDAFANWAGEKNAKRIWVRVSAANAGAIRFYQRELFADYDVILEREIRGTERG